jgi:serine/threonine protein kinase
MAPEVFEEKYSFAADIWSIGCVSYQMVTGKPPWESLGFYSLVALFKHVKSHPPPPMESPTLSSTSISGAMVVTLLRSLVSDCFQLAPMERPTAAELRDDTFFLDPQEHVSSHQMLGMLSPLSWGNMHSPSSTSSPNGLARRSSINHSPYILSPPMPKRCFENACSPLLSPSAITVDWPTWAKNEAKKKADQCKLYKDTTHDPNAMQVDVLESTL